MTFFRHGIGPLGRLVRPVPHRVASLLLVLSITLIACDSPSTPTGTLRDVRPDIAANAYGSGDGGSEEAPWCPHPYIFDITIHGNINPPGHKIVIGTPSRPLEFQEVVEVSATGLRKGRYEIIQTLPGREWFGEDKKIWIRSGLVDGWCWFVRDPGSTSILYGSSGDLHVTAFQGVWGNSPPPKPKGRLGYNGTTSQNLSIALPPASTAWIFLDGTLSAKGMDSEDAPAITSYAWTVGGSSAANASTGSYNVTNDVTIRLKVTDQAEGEATDDATVNVEHAPCPDGSIYQPEGCPASSSSPETIGLPGSAWRPAIEVGGPLPPMQLVCYVTDWYDVMIQGDYVSIAYNSTTIDYCQYE